MENTVRYILFAKNDITDTVGWVDIRTRTNVPNLTFKNNENIDEKSVLTK
jgi:hypothetical protein